MDMLSSSLFKDYTGGIGVKAPDKVSTGIFILADKHLPLTLAKLETKTDARNA